MSPSNRSSAVRVSVVQVSYNSREVLSDSIAPLVGADWIQLLVADNASSDGTADFIAAAFPKVQLTRNQENLGFAAAVNAVAMSGLGDMILLLNPDAIIDSETLYSLVSVLDNDDSVAIVAPGLVQPQGRLNVMEVGRFPTLWRVFCHYSGLSRLAKFGRAVEGLYLLNGQVSGARGVDWVSGACMLVRKSVWLELGGMTERWFMYAEDLEFCLRVKRAGYRIVIEPDLFATHVMGGSSAANTGSKGNRVQSMWLTNLYELYDSNLSSSPVASWLWKVVVSAGMCSRSAAYALRALRSGRGPRRTMWQVESSKFRQHASALWLRGRSQG